MPNSILASGKMKLSGVRHYLFYRHIYERPRPGFRKRVADSFNDMYFQSCATSLCEKGVAILPSFFSGEKLESMQIDYERWASAAPLDANHTKQFGRSYLSDSAALSQAALNPFLIGLAKYYWGKPIFLAEAAGYRLEPTTTDDYGSFQWHHDAKRKQVKIMILLSDVSDSGQRMDYLPGTHKNWHTGLNAYEDSRFTPETLEKYGEPIRCSGPAGTVIVFDTNGLHRGNRNLQDRRDVYIFTYSGGRRLSPPSPIHPSLLNDLSSENRLITRLDE